MGSNQDLIERLNFRIKQAQKIKDPKKRKQAIAKLKQMILAAKMAQRASKQGFAFSKGDQEDDG